MKNFYIAIQTKKNEKYYAYVLKTTDSRNLLSELNIKDIITATIAPTKKEAEKWVKCWNDDWKKQGKYLFDEILF